MLPPQTIYLKKIYVFVLKINLCTNVGRHSRKQWWEYVNAFKIICDCENKTKKLELSHLFKSTYSQLENSQIILYHKKIGSIALEAEFTIILGHTLEHQKISMRQLILPIDTIYPIIEIHNLVLHSDELYGA